MVSLLWRERVREQRQGTRQELLTTHDAPRPMRRGMDPGHGFKLFTFNSVYVWDWKFILRHLQSLYTITGDNNYEQHILDDSTCV